MKNKTYSINKDVYRQMEMGNIERTDLSNLEKISCMPNVDFLIDKEHLFELFKEYLNFGISTHYSTTNEQRRNYEMVKLFFGIDGEMKEIKPIAEEYKIKEDYLRKVINRTIDGFYKNCLSDVIEGNDFDPHTTTEKREKNRLIDRIFNTWPKRRDYWI